jgi:hypothetical protein
MGRKKKPEPDDKEQSARFIEAAGKIETDMDKEEFKQVCSKILKANKPAKLKKG